MKNTTKFTATYNPSAISNSRCGERTGVGWDWPTRLERNGLHRIFPIGKSRAAQGIRGTSPRTTFRVESILVHSNLEHTLLSHSDKEREKRTPNATYTKSNSIPQVPPGWKSNYPRPDAVRSIQSCRGHAASSRRFQRSQLRAMGPHGSRHWDWRVSPGFAMAILRFTPGRVTRGRWCKGVSICG